ncbi:uncharacterized protein LOC109848843 [Asparagus officinalis]|nr:uncharacterized protein LOC109848843 [Asparagus officinalis]XP_020274141.1 uncharacterized protein LOC109848843 [Asparagus officinalis]
MLSIENPSCSSKDSDLASGHGDHQAQPPNFSIRDYVFKSRSKDIKVNWPFREQLLQLCLDNGITGLLPPLQPPSLVRAHCLRKQLDSDFAKNKTIFENQDSEENVELESLLHLNSLTEERRKLNASSMISHEHSEGISGDQLKKRCKLAIKSDLLSNPVSVSDPMASKVCPVCKSFTSSSNTTLNAHIDQCLSSDQSDAIKDVSELQKYRAQPRKKRSMVDIYRTARHCTLEDLDRRNGTNWAVTLAPMAPADDANFAPSSPANDHNLEMKRTMSEPSVSVKEGNVGDIYVDSNGTKLLILSNFNDSPSSVSRKNFKLKKKISKKKILKQKGSEFTNDNPQKRKLRRFKEFNSENEAAIEEDLITEAYQEKEESISHLLSTHDQVKHSEPSTLGHWVCSKRSDLPRKVNNKDISEESKSRKLSMSYTLSESAPSIQRNKVSNYSISSEAAVSPKPKDINILFNTDKNMGSGKKKSPQPSNLHSKLLSESCHPSLKVRKNPTFKKSGFTRTCISLEEIEKVEKLIPPKKFKKQRSILGCNKRRGEKNSIVNGGIDDSTEDFGLVSSRANEASETHQSNFSDNQEKGSSEVTELICRDETLEELSAETTYSQKAQFGDAVTNEGIQISDDQAEQISQHEDFDANSSFFEEPNPDDGDKVPENTQENSSTTFVRADSNPDHSMILDMDSSASVSPSSPVDVNIKNSEGDQLVKDASNHNELSPLTMRKDNKAITKEPLCSCSESLSRESQFSYQTRKNTISHLFIKPPAPSHLQVCPSLESHTESVVTTDSSQSSLNVSTPCSRVNSASNPILRLMGKDLVVSKEETNFPSTSSYNSQPKLISFGFPSNVGFISYKNNYQHQFQAMGNHQIPLQHLQRSNMHIPPSHYYMNRMVASENHQPKPIIHSNQAREVIVIDDDSHGLRAEQRAQSSNIMTSQRMFACCPSYKPYVSGAFTLGQRETSQDPFVFPSPSSLYISPNRR